MPKTIVIPDPTEAQIVNISLGYERGAFVGGTISIAGVDETGEVRHINFAAADLSPSVRVTVAGLATAALARVKATLGFA